MTFKKGLIIIFTLFILCLSLNVVSASDVDSINLNDNYLIEDNNLNSVDYYLDDIDAPKLENNGSEKITTVITAKDISFNYASSKDLVINLKDNSGNAIANKQINVLIKGITTNLITDENGTAIFNYKNSVGTYSVSISFDGDEEYMPSSASSKITITKSSTSLYVPSVRSYVTKSTYLVVTLKDGLGNGIAKKIVKVSIKGVKKVYTLKTDSNGVAKLKFSNKVRNSKVTVKFAGDTNYKSSSASSKVVITKMKTYLKVPSVRSYVTKSTYLVVTLKDGLGNGIAKKIVKVSIKGVKKVYTLKTDSNGVAKLKFSNKVRNSKVTVKFVGGSKYYSSSASSKVVITKMPVSISAPSITINSDKYGYFNINLKDVDKKPIKSKSVSISVPSINKVYKKTTDSSGNIKLKLNSFKTSDITVKFAGDSKYSAKTVKSKITVNQVKISFNDAVKASVLLKDYVFENKKLPEFIEVDGKNFTASEVSYLSVAVIKNINNKNKNSIVLIPVSAPSSISGTEIYDTVYKKDYLSLANKCYSYMVSNHYAPAYLTYSFYKIRYDLYTASFARIVNYYNDNKVLPNYRLFTSSEFVKIDSSKKYTFYLTSDNIASKKQDTAMLKKLAKTIKSMGYDAVIVGIGPDIHNIAFQYGCVGNNSILLCCFGGVDVGCIEEWSGELKTQGISFTERYSGAHVLALWYTKPYGNSVSIYKPVKRAWDADYGWALSNPSKYMDQHDISYIQTSTVDKACSLLKNHKIGGYDLFK